MVVGGGSEDEDDCGAQKARKSFIGEPEVAAKGPSGKTDEISMTVLESDSRKNMLGPQSAAILASQLSVIHEVSDGDDDCGGFDGSSNE